MEKQTVQRAPIQSTKHSGLWIAQILLCLVFLLAGALKTVQSIETLAASMTWVTDFSPLQIRALGGLELLVSLGIILPYRLQIVPILTPIAAVGIVAIILGAIPIHMAKGEIGPIIVNLVILGLAGWVAYGRFKELRQRKPNSI